MIYSMCWFVVDVNNREIVVSLVQTTVNTHLIDNQSVINIYCSKKRTVRKAPNCSLMLRPMRSFD